MTLVALIGGCAVVDTPQLAVYALELLDGEAVFGHTVVPAPAQDVLSISPEMQRFIVGDFGQSPFSHVRFRRLLQKLEQQGFFANPYDQSATFSAAQTFDSKKGNCIAYTNLFIALARGARIHARYQKVHIPLTWELSSGLLLRVNHINARVDGVRLPGSGSHEISVDFNSVRLGEDSRKEIISDERAASMFYANLSIKHMREADYEEAFAYLKRAALTAGDNPDVWINLGALYSMLNHDAYAEQAYQVARSIDGKDQAAISGLVKVLRKQGRVEEAEVFVTLALRYQRANPYYHYAKAEQAFNAGAFDQAMTAINRAIKLKRRNPQFYAFRAAMAQQLGDQRLFTKSVRLQRRFRKKES